MEELVFLKNLADYEEYKKQKPVNAFKYRRVQFICSCCGNLSTKSFNTLAPDFLCTHCKISQAVSKPEVTTKKRQTNLKRYGVTHYNKTEESKKRHKKTNLERHGKEHFAQTDEFKKDFKRHCQETYHVDNVFQLKEIKEKSKQTTRENYGVDYYTQTEEFHKRYVNTCTEKFGVDNYMKTDEYKNKLFKKACRTYNKAVKVLSFYTKDNTDRYAKCQCIKCGKEFEIRYLLLRARFFANEDICTFCNPINRDNLISNEEKTLVNFIKSIYTGSIIENDRKILNGKEIDIYLPELNLAFEFDGLYWHNETFVENDYHLNKTEECLKYGIRLIHIFEDEWVYKRNIVKSRIKSLLNNNEHIFARKCELKEVPYDIADNFLEQNHIQGKCVSKYRYGLYYNDELVSIMTFGKSRFSDEIELLRFCNKLDTNVIGGASKLFKYFLKKNPHIKKVITFADRRWSVGNLYDKLGFIKDSITVPSYYYILHGYRHNRLEFQKHKLVKQGFDKEKSEHEIMLERKIYRIYDCGNIKYIYELINC